MSLGIFCFFSFAGNKNLLNVCVLWGHLIHHYENKSCLVDGEVWPRI